MHAEKDRKTGNFKKTTGNELITIKAEDQENMTVPDGRRDIELKELSIEIELAKCSGVY